MNAVDGDISMNKVTLTQYEMVTAAMAGVFRHAENMANGVKDRHCANEKNGWQVHIDGALAECALAKWIDRYWEGKGTRGGSDVGPYDVRHAISDNLRLIIHDYDPDQRIFFFVTGSNGQYAVQGGIRAIDGKKKQYWWADAPSPAYFIPKDRLISAEQLRDLIVSGDA